MITHWRWGRALAIGLLLASAPLAAGTAQSAAPARQQQLPDGSLYQLRSAWTTQHDQLLDLAQLRGEVVVLAMVYTSCTMTCPLITNDMLAVQYALPPDLRSRVRFVLASFDPARDSVPVLRAYIKTMKLDERWLTLRAEPTDVRQLALLLGVRYRQLPSGDFDHSNIISVLDGNGVPVHQSARMPADRAGLVAAIVAASRRPEP